MFYTIISIMWCLCSFFITPAEKINLQEIFKALSSYDTAKINVLIVKHPSLLQKRFVSGNYFIHYCILHNAYSVIKKNLVKPDILLLQNSFGQTALHYALQLYTKSINDKTLLCHIIHLLIQNSPEAIFLYKDIHGNTIFHTSIFTKSPTIMAEIHNRLITFKETKKYLYTKNHRNKTPLHLLIESFFYLKKPPTIKAIILHFLENTSHNDLIQRDEEGNTIAHLLAHFKLEDFFSLIQYQSALFSIKNNYKQLPLHILIDNFNASQEDFLLIQKCKNNSLSQYYEEDLLHTSPALFYESPHPLYPKKNSSSCYYMLNDFYKEVLNSSFHNQEKSLSIDSLESLESTEYNEEIITCEEFKDLEPAQEDQTSPDWYQ